MLYPWRRPFPALGTLLSAELNQPGEPPRGLPGVRPRGAARWRSENRHGSRPRPAQIYLSDANTSLSEWEIIKGITLTR